MDERENRKGRSAPVLQWMRDAIVVEETCECRVEDVASLDGRLKKYLVGCEIENLFAIQLAVWELTCGGKSGMHNVCFSAPTGSGKTLAYGLAIVNALAAENQRCRELKCVVVVPTRGLGLQVCSVLEPLGNSVGLKTVAACGCASVQEEAKVLVDHVSYDIVVCTPGRLVSHLESTKNFALACGRVKYFVVDEADRLLRQSYNDWISKVFDAFEGRSGVQKKEYGQYNNDNDGSGMVSNTCGHAGPLKFIVSATLTRDPSKLEVLRLQGPRFITFVQGGSFHSVKFVMVVQYFLKKAQ